jgi:ribosomal protein L9
MPLTLLEPLVEPYVRQFLSSRKRAMTSQEAAEQEERDKAQQRQQAAQEARTSTTRTAFGLLK